MAKKEERKKHLVHPLLMSTLSLSVVSALTLYGVDYVRNLRKEEVALKIFASGIVQREKYSKDMKNEMINFDSHYDYTTREEVTATEYTDGEHLANQLIENGVRCSYINGNFYSLNGETIMYYYREVRDDLVKEGVVYPDENRRFIIPKGLDFSDCTVISTSLYEDIDPDLIITKKELDKALVLSK